MKLVRFGDVGKEKPGILLNEKWFDMSSFTEDYGEIFFATNGLKKLEALVEKDASNFPEIPKGVRIGSPVARPSKIVCIGLNYADHARESNAPIPTEPVIFLKATSSFCGPFDDIIIPKNSEKTDWEVELAVVIEKRASYVSEADAMEYV